MSLTSSKLGWPRKRRAEESGRTVTGLGWVPGRKATPLATEEDAVAPTQIIAETPEPSADVSRETAGPDEASETAVLSSDSVSRETNPSPFAEIVDDPPTAPEIAPEIVGEDGDPDADSGEDHVSRETSKSDGVTAAGNEEQDAAGNPDVSRETSASDETVQHTSEAVPAIATTPASEPEPTVDPESETAEQAPTPAVERASAATRPAQPRIITVSNQKGGVGKTTTTVNLAAALSMSGLKVLVIDLDPQGNASTGLGIDHPPGTPSTYNVVVDKTPLADVAQEVSAPGVPAGLLYGVPATSDLAGAEVELAGVMVGREFRLRQAVSDFLALHTGEDRFDYVFIDCPPSLGLLTVNALAAAAEVLIPVQCEYYALEGLGQLLETVELIKGYLNPSLHVSTMLLTMFDARTKLAGQVVDEVRAHFGDTVMRSIIPRSVKVSEAPSYGMSVLSYDHNSRGAVAYVSAASELVTRQ